MTVKEKKIIKFDGIPYSVSKEQAEEKDLIVQYKNLKYNKKIIERKFKEVQKELIKRAEKKRTEKGTVYLGGIKLRVRVVFDRVKDWNQDLLNDICSRFARRFLKYFEAKPVYIPRPIINELLNNPCQAEEELAAEVREAIVWKQRAPKLMVQEKIEDEWKPVK